MARASFRVSAPGKLMLLGEHAVLHGSHCLVCGVSQRLSIIVTPRQDRRLIIRSALGNYEATLDSVSPSPQFRFILAAVNQFPQPLTTGLELEVHSDFSADVGLGSSAAVTAAVGAALCQLTLKNVERQKVFDFGLQVIRSVQGTGSGADLAASVFGGVLLYRAEPFTCERLDNLYPISVVYSGAKTPTTQVIARVEESRRRFSELFDAIFGIMDKSALWAAEAIRADDWRTFGELLNLNQGLMDAIGVSNARLAQIVYALRAQPGILGAKISGSGLGDCVVGLGDAGVDCGYEVLPIQMSREGIRID
ncbi:MAG: mevalonate kinase [candidate division KSB1 bacterium]|nr:mevalonate kinase [candidate division KSB1 bacterium]MDZ7345509.1 mevalonate kinase [candidate division KSB1 bacterium]